MDVSKLHPSIVHFIPLFACGHLSPELQEISRPFGELAALVMEKCGGPEASVALRKLLEAKDCAVRACFLAGADKVAAVETKTPRKLRDFTDEEFHAEFERRHGFDGDCG